MGIFTRLLTPEKRALEMTPNLERWLIGNRSATGMDVTPESALNLLAVYACIRVLAEAVAQLPLIVYRRLPGGGKERATDHPLYPLLHDLPNREMTSFSLRETMVGHQCGWGNAYAEIEWNGAGDAIGLWPLRPDWMKVDRDANGLVYEYGTGLERRVLPGWRMLHIPGLGFDGRVGYTPIEIASEAIGIGLAAQEFEARFFQNDARPGIVLEHPGHLGDEAYKHLQDSWRDEHGGVMNASKPGILEEGMKIHEVGLPSKDVEFLATRKFQKQEIASLYRVPPHMIADLERATFSNIEQQSLEFVVFTLTPWLTRWEQAITWKLIPPAQRSEYFAEFLVDGLLRGDMASRYTAYATGRQNGWLSANDIRERENMNPVDGGDVYLIPMNMIEAGSGGVQLNAPTNAPTSAAAGGVPSAARVLALSADGQRLTELEGMARLGAPSPHFDEERSYKSARNRNRLTHAYQRMFKDVWARVIRREQADIRKAVERFLGQRDLANFNLWLASFYREHRQFVERQVSPLYHSFRDAVATAAQDEVDAAGKDMSADLEKFANQYIVGVSWRHCDIGEAKIKKALDGAENPGAAIDGELASWDGDGTTGSRAETTTMWESVRFGNAIAATVFALAGREFIKWHSFGDSCPYCKHLNGRKVGIKETFLSPGEEFKPDGADKPLTVSNKVHHPPAHGGCDCTIGAG